MTTGEKIRQIRKSKGLTQKRLGELCDPKINEVQIRLYELGKTNPKIETLCRISKALDVDVSELTNIFELWDKECNKGKLNKEVNSLEVIEKFLESIGYICEFTHDVEKWHYEDVYDDSNKLIGKSQVADEDTYSVKLTKNGVCTTYSKEEFEQFKIDIEQSIDYLVWKKERDDK